MARFPFRSDLFRGASASFVMRMASVGLGYLVTLALARLLGPAGYGVYSFLLAAITLLGLPAQFGLPMLLVREVGAARVRQEWGKLRGLTIWAHRFSLTASLPIVALAAAGAVFFPQLIGPDRRLAVMWGVALILLLPLMALRGGVLRGLQKVIVGQAPEQLVRPLVLLACLFIPVLWGSKTDTPAEAMAANVIAAAAAWVVGTVVLMRVWPAEARSAEPVYETKRWRASLLPLGLANSMYLIDGQVGVLLLGLFASAAEVGIYKAATQGALFSAMGYVAVNTAIAPRLAAAWARDDRAAVQNAVTRGARLSVAFCAPVALAFFAIQPWGLELLFGKGFGPAWGPLVVLGLGQVINAAFGSATALLNMSHHERSNTIAFAVGLALTAALTAALAPAFGAMGAAVAATVSLFLRNALLWWFARRGPRMETGFWGPRRDRPE